MRALVVLAAGVSIALGGSACAFRRPIEDHAVAYNLALERAQNRVLLLNVVRSLLGRPRHFTAVTQIRGNLSGEVSSIWALPFGRSPSDSFLATLSGSVKSSPNFDVAVLESKEFVRGITRPIASATFEYYWSQGWKPELLLHLFVREARLGDSGVTNYPADPGERLLFSEFVRQFVALKPRFKKSEDEDYGPSLSGNQVTAEGLAKAREQKLKASEKGPGALQLKTPGVGYKIVCPSGCRLSAFGVDASDPVAFPGGDALKKWSDDFAGRELDRIVSLGRSPRKEPDPKELRLILRSPEQMLYYLGELARADLCDGIAPPRIRKSGSEVDTEPLFVLRRSPRVRHDASCGNAPAGLSAWLLDQDSADRWIDIGYEGDHYWIPGSQGGRSSSALTLVQQLLALHKAAEELPTTSTVTVSGD